MSKKEKTEKMMSIAACSNCYDKAENYCSGSRLNCTYKNNMKMNIENLVKAGYGDIKQAQINILNKLKKIIHEDSFQQMCLDGTVEEADVFNYIDNLIEDIQKEE